METLGLWIVPFTFLGGVGLLILSTSNRFNTLHAEIHRLDEEEKKKQTEWVRQAFKRATLFRDAMVALYVSIGFFSLSSLLASLTRQWPDISHGILNSFAILGVSCVVFAAFQLIRESFMSIGVIKNHLGFD